MPGPWEPWALLPLPFWQGARRYKVSQVLRLDQTPMRSLLSKARLGQMVHQVSPVWQASEGFRGSPALEDPKVLRARRVLPARKVPLALKVLLAHRGLLGRMAKMGNPVYLRYYSPTTQKDSTTRAFRTRSQSERSWLAWTTTIVLKATFQIVPLSFLSPCQQANGLSACPQDFHLITIQRTLEVPV